MKVYFRSLKNAFVIGRAPSETEPSINFALEGLTKKTFVF